MDVVSPKHQVCTSSQASSRFELPELHVPVQRYSFLIRAECMSLPKRFSPMVGCEAVITPAITLVRYRRLRPSSLKDGACLLQGRSGSIRLVEVTTACHSSPNCRALCRVQARNSKHV